MLEPNSDPSTVFIAENSKIAEAVVQLLASHDIAAEVYTEPTQTISEPVTGVSEVSPAEKFEIRVSVAAKVDEARKLLTLAENNAIITAIREKRLQRTGTVSAVCEDCGQSSEWPADAMGTTETCPNCGAYMDIPDPDDDWSGVDFGTDDDENETAK
jgi:hypothetical protein